MEKLTGLFGRSTRFAYHSFDRIVIRGYLSTLSRAENIEYFFRTIKQVECIGKETLRQGKWKLHLVRDKEPVGAAPFSVNRHIAPADRVGFDAPFLVDLDKDIGETTNVAAQHPEIVKRLLGLAEAMRDDPGDYDRVGKNMRFFDPIDPRPTKPPVPRPRKRKARKKTG